MHEIFEKAKTIERLLERFNTGTSVTQYDWQENVKNCGMSEPMCHASRNFYRFTLSNALINAAHFKVTLMCTAMPAYTVDFMVQALSARDNLAISPPSPYLIAKTACSLVTEIEALNTTDPDDYIELSSFSSTCGTPIDLDPVFC